MWSTLRTKDTETTWWTPLNNQSHSTKPVTSLDLQNHTLIGVYWNERIRWSSTPLVWHNLDQLRSRCSWCCSCPSQVSTDNQIKDVLPVVALILKSLVQQGWSKPRIVKRDSLWIDEVIQTHPYQMEWRQNTYTMPIDYDQKGESFFSYFAMYVFCLHSYTWLPHLHLPTNDGVCSNTQIHSFYNPICLNITMLTMSVCWSHADNRFWKCLVVFDITISAGHWSFPDIKSMYDANKRPRFHLCEPILPK